MIKPELNRVCTMQATKTIGLPEGLKPVEQKGLAKTSV